MMHRIVRRGRVFVIALAAMLAFSLGTPSQAFASQKVTESPAATVAPERDSGQDCRGYNFTHGKYHYTRYCYDWKYRNDNDRKHDKRWYYRYDLYYWYYDNHHHKKYDSCYYNHNFGYHHPNGPYKRYCDHEHGA